MLLFVFGSTLPATQQSVPEYPDYSLCTRVHQPLEVHEVMLSLDPVGNRKGCTVGCSVHKYFLGASKDHAAVSEGVAVVAAAQCLSYRWIDLKDVVVSRVQKRRWTIVIAAVAKLEYSRAELPAMDEELVGVEEERVDDS